jgi:ketosteroid isomerase-like protein
MRIRTIIGGLIAVFAIGLFNQSLLADSEKNLHKMFYIKLKTGHMAQFYADLAEHAAWRREAGDPWTWWVHQVVNGKNDGDCIIRSGSLTWADIDAYEEFNAKGGEEFWKAVGEHIEDSSSWISRNDLRFENWPPDMSKVRLISVTTIQLKPGMAKDFSAAVKVYHDAITENEYPAYYHWSWTVNGGSGNQVTRANFFENYADMAPPEEKMWKFMERVLGEDEAAAVREKLAGTVRSSTSQIVRYLPELSIVHEKE